MDNGTAAWISAGAAIGGGFVGGSVPVCFQVLKDWYQSPKLILDYGVHEDQSKVHVKTGANEGAIDRVYVRVRVRNAGRTVARNCSVYLASIEEIHESGIKATAFLDAMLLSWPLDDFEARNTPPGVDFYLDLLYVNKGEPGWHFGVKRLYASQTHMLDFKGTYRFNMVATADNAKAYKYSLKVKYEHDWHHLHVFQE